MLEAGARVEKWCYTLMYGTYHFRNVFSLELSPRCVNRASPMIYAKTELGQAALQSRSPALAPRQRSALIMFDGKRSVDLVLKATAGLGITDDDVNHLLELKFLAVVESGMPASVSAAVIPGVAEATSGQADSALPTFDAQAHYSRAYPIATRLTAGLGLRGFRLNLAVEAAGNLAKLQELAPRIKEAVGPEKFRELQSALYD